MAAIAQPLEGSNGRLVWLWQFLREELAPYRGRGALVARMVTASTLVMIISMTFQIPYGAYGAVYAFTLSRESLEGTASAVRTLAVGFAIAGAYAVLGAMLVLGDPTLRFLWVVGTLFLIFYAMSAMNNYAGVTRFGYLIVITIPLWDRQIPPELKIEGTLWAVGTLTIASLITLLLEIVFAAFKRTDDLIEGIAQRLVSVEELLVSNADGRPADAATQSEVTHLATVGTSRLRRILQRSSHGEQYAQQMGAVVALVGRLVDIAANLPQVSGGVTDDDRKRFRAVGQSIAEIRASLKSGAVPHPSGLPSGLPSDGEGPTGPPLLREIEKTVSLIPEVFRGSQSLSLYAPPPPGNRRQPILPALGALSNSEHVKFGLRGCLAASLCYITYNSLFWPGISTAITTCLLTALSTIGSSRQKQILRFAGALVGGVGIGMVAQIIILPNIDSIGGFAVLFALVAAAAAWVATSSARLSYFGVQVIVAFCLINLEEFKIRTSLVAARDRVVGILLGLFMMWLAYDHLWSVPAGVEMKRAFISALRLLAQLFREPVSKDIRVAAERSYTLRDTINAQFDKVRSLADGVLFEFGSYRQPNLLLRSRIRRWQPQLRTLFLMRIASLKYRLQLPGFELPVDIRVFQQRYDDRSAQLLEDMADRIERNGQAITAGSDDSPDLLNQTLEETEAKASRQLPPGRAQSFITLLQGIHGLTTSLAVEITAEFDRPSNRPA